MYTRLLKRIIDFSLSLVLVCLLTPLFLVIIIFLYINLNHKSPFFIQKRVGYKEKIFKIYKFKTMNDLKDSYGNLLPDSERVTNFGKVLRKTSLDELPQLLNVIIGDMSIIGPRPLLVQYLTLYNDHQRHRHDVKPGITGWAQINGRNTLSWKQKFDLDIWYVDNISFKIDFIIFYKTILKVINSEGVNSNFSTTMEVFNGEN